MAQPVGAGWYWPGARHVAGTGGAGGVRRACRQGAGKLEVGDEGRGNFVNKSKFKNQFCNFKFSPSSGPQMKKVLNTTFAQFFEIYNFCVMHFFIRAIV